MAEVVKRGWVWNFGRAVVIASALAIPLALWFAPRQISDKSGKAKAEIARLQTQEENAFRTAGRYTTETVATADYTITVMPQKQGYLLLATPVDPRQKTFASDETKAVRIVQMYGPTLP